MGETGEDCEQGDGLRQSLGARIELRTSTGRATAIGRVPGTTIALAVLALGTFAIGTDGHIVIGLLDKIASGFGVSSSRAGQLVTVFALCYALFAPVCGWLFGGFDRETAIRIASGTFILGNAVCWLARNYPAMVAGRVIAAFGAGMFTPLAFTIATKLAGNARRGVALSAVFGGMTIAMLIGVPAGAYLGQRIDWHLVFLIIGAIGVVDLALLNAFLPAMPPSARTTLWERLAPVRDRAVLITLSITLAGVLSEFTLYTYIRVLFEGVTVASRGILPVVLFTFGAGALAGNVVVGIATDRLGPRWMLLTALGAQTALMPAIFLVRHLPVTAICVSFAWGIVSYMYLVPIQHRLLELAKTAGQMTMSLNSSAIYLGIAGGGALGGLALAHFGIASLPILSAALGIGVLLVILRQF
jgi:predicted MFS family arabinose efflux permease